MKEEILKLRQEGKSYKQIKKILGCSLGTIAYHCGVGQKEKCRTRSQKQRKDICVIKKVDNFQSKVLIPKFEKPFNEKNEKRKLKDKTEDFQRLRKEGRKRKLKFNWKDVINKFGWNTVCYLTGKPISLLEPKSYNFDHIVPVSRGGSNEIENLGIACRVANYAKSDMLVDEFLMLCKEVLEFNGYKVEYEG